MLIRNLKPEKVFTPRSADVNTEIYVTRPDLEKALKNALRGNLHMLIHGESGSGKSWLYKKTFKENEIKFIVANSANASRLGSIDLELKNLIDREGNELKISYDETKNAEINALAAKGGLSHKDSYTIGQKEPFESCLSLLNKKAKGNPSVLVIDNLEAAFTEKLMKELADLIILCDDERYAKYNVKMLIVGVPSGIKEYYYKTPHHATVANRIHELPEVSRLGRDECKELITKGFVGLLKYNLENIDEIVSHIDWITDRLPQIIHEYCLELAYLGEENNKTITLEMLKEADAIWLNKSQYHSYAVIESNMNERDTKAGRRNQTLYALSFCEGEQFKAQDVEAILRKKFPISTKDTALNVPQTLSGLAKSDHPVVRKSPKGDAFTFHDPRYRIVLRTMLQKTDRETVDKIPISR